MTRRERQLRRYEALSRHAFGILIGGTIAVCLPFAVVISRTAGPDIFDLVPRVSQSEGYLLVAWPDLERARFALSTVGVYSGTMVRALGYMMEAGPRIPDGREVDRFVLLPDDATSLHPAHRFGDQMIDVHLAAGSTVRFSERRLVWVLGRIRSLPGDPAGPQPLYVLENARVEPAGRTDIARYFR